MKLLRTAWSTAASEAQTEALAELTEFFERFGRSLCVCCMTPGMSRVQSLEVLGVRGMALRTATTAKPMASERISTERISTKWISTGRAAP